MPAGSNWHARPGTRHAACCIVAGESVVVAGRGCGAQAIPRRDAAPQPAAHDPHAAGIGVRHANLWRRRRSRFCHERRQRSRERPRPLDWTALVTLVAGGLNCGLIAAVNLDVFARMLPWSLGGRVAYGLVGLAALHCVVLLFRLAADEA